MNILYFILGGLFYLAVIGMAYGVRVYRRGRKHDFDLEHPIEFTARMSIVYQGEQLGTLPAVPITQYKCIACGEVLTGLNRRDMETLPDSMGYGCPGEWPDVVGE